MAQRLGLPEEELVRRARAITILSLGLLAAAVTGALISAIIWVFERDYPIVPITSITVAVMLTSLLTYWLVSIGRVKFAGYFFIIGFLFEVAIATTLFGGFAGPVSIAYLFPIIASGIVIGINVSFLVATLATVLYLVMMFAEQAGFLPLLMVREAEGYIISYFTVITRVIFFYLVAFLSWFAASRLSLALQNVRRYAGELQTTNENLQASEEELRSANEELQATEEELRASNEELQTANEELIETQEQLVRSEKLAAIGQLAGGVGHELRNPLGAIKNAVYYLKGKLAGSELVRREPRIMEFLGIMDDEVSSSDKIISDLLNFSRVGKPAVSPARIEKVIDDAIVHTHIPENIELTKQVAANLPEVEVDTDQVRQVLVNVITNAVQAMPDGGELLVGAEQSDGFLEVAVGDTGSGIAKEIIDKVFDPLYTTRAKGIGLGLAVCKSIIDRHGGSIGAVSEAGKGTTFSIKLPLNRK